MTVDFGFTTTPTAVTLAQFQAGNQTLAQWLWRAVVDGLAALR